MAEHVNQAIVRILRKIGEDHKRNWDTKLNVALWAYCTTFNVALWAYHTTFKVTTKQTSFALVFGIEPILSIELEISTLCIAIEAQMPIVESIQDWLLMLEEVNES